MNDEESCLIHFPISIPWSAPFLDFLWLWPRIFPFDWIQELWKQDCLLAESCLWLFLFWKQSINIHRGSFDFHSYGSPVFHPRFFVIVCKQLAPSLWHGLLWSLTPAFLKGTEQNQMPCMKYPSRQLGLIFLRTTKYYGYNIWYLIWCSVP